MGSKEAQLAIFDGQNFVFNQSSWSVITLYRMVRRYGLAYFRFQAAPKALLKKFKRVYQLQAEGHAFATPEQLLQKLELYDMTQRSMRAEIQVRSISFPPECQVLAANAVYPDSWNQTSTGIRIP